MPSDTIANSGLPARVGQAASALFEATRATLVPRIEVMLMTLADTMYEQADKSRNTSVQMVWLRGAQALRHERGGFVPAYLRLLEARLAGIRRAPARRQEALGALLSSSQWVLEGQSDEADHESRLQELASTLEGQAQLPLYLLGQRFGVLAAAPAFEARHNPVGPRTLLEVAVEASQEALDGNVPAEVLMPAFAEQVLSGYPAIVEQANRVLEQEGVLPGLVYVPARPPKATRGLRASPPMEPREPPGPKNDPANLLQPTALAGLGSLALAQPPDEWLQQPMPASVPSAPASETPRPAAEPDFLTLQQLLTACRVAGSPPAARPAAVSTPLARPQLAGVLDALQDEQAAGLAPSAMPLQDRVLTRAATLHGNGAALPREDVDVLQILSLLQGEIGTQIKSDSPAKGHLQRLELPLLRAALDNPAFFSDPAHPARQLLNTVAESGAAIHGEGSDDPLLAAAVENAVKRLETEFRGQPGLLEEVNAQLQRDVELLVRRAQANEKRLVEAARGRERMTVAKQIVRREVEARIARQPLPRVTEMLLRKSWSDALVLSLLRHGEKSHGWDQQLALTDEMLATITADGAVESPSLAEKVNAAMLRVGYHHAAAQAVARQLSRSPGFPRGDDDATATELSALIKSHARFGPDDDDRPPGPPSLAADEMQCLEQLSELPFGTWLDAREAPETEALRQRLSWHSRQTRDALLVNRRGQRTQETTLDDLARRMAAKRLEVVGPEDLRIVDRALRSTVDRLQETLRAGLPKPPGRPQ